MKFFCKAGPVKPEDHYCLPLSKRLDEQNLRSLIDQKKYFILHAPRQTGKTSTMINFAKTLNAEGKYAALYVNVEGGQAARSNFREGLLTILKSFKAAIDYTCGKSNPGMRYFDKDPTLASISGNELFDFLQFWSQHSIKPLVLFIDEVDALIGDTLISVLRQLRAGYPQRPRAFPQSVCLIGVRDVRDYRIWSDVEHQVILGGSAFNIKDESLRLRDFSQDEVRELYLQHTQETGQKFDNDAINYAFELTQGQPWLVNALAYQACFVDVTDRSIPITKEAIESAKETLILRQDTHIDALIDKLREQRIRNIIDAIISSQTQAPICDDDDVRYASDLGLIKVDAKDMKIANPIYQEIFPRILATKLQRALSGRPVDYVLPNGLLDMHKLLLAFAEFYRENSAIWLEKFDYKESGPHLILLAFLQRIINGGGRIHREYALGADRVDLCIDWPYFAKATKVRPAQGQAQRIVIELKVWKGPKTLQVALEQTASYMDVSNATEGHLVIFDPSKTKSWDEKVYQRTEICSSKTIHVWGM